MIDGFAKKHLPITEDLFNHIAKIDFEQANDYFCFKSGGDGDNGEVLMDEIDDYLKTYKYRWHNLRENPDDLPKTEEPIIAAIKFYGKGSEYMNPICYTEGIYELFFKQWNLDEDGKWHDEYNPYVLYKVIAWKYIEPFDGGDAE